MGGFINIGSVVIAVFPFSDLSKSKRRPVLVLAEAEFGDYISCQITSSSQSSKTAIELRKNDFVDGSLPRDSFIRVDKLFTADPLTVLYKAGDLQPAKMKKVKSELARLFELAKTP